MKKQPILFSEIYGITTSEQDEWFDTRLDRDTHLCIDPFQVFKSKDPFFIKSRQKFTRFFESAFSVAAEIGEAPSKEDQKSGNLPSKYKRLIQETLLFPEVQEVCLGFSKRGTGGIGGGKDFAIKLSDALIKFSKRSISPPKHFEEIEIFTPGIGKDKISDLTGNLIKKELINYTRDVCRKLAINDGNLEWQAVKNYDFDFEYNEWDNGGFYLPFNPFNGFPILLVPKAFLREIPSIGSEELYRFIKSKDNEQLRAKLNSGLHDDLEKYDADKEEENNSSIKRFVLDQVEKHPEIFKEFLNDVEINSNLYTQYNFEKDAKNIIKLPRIIKEFVDENPLPRSTYSNPEEFYKFLNSLILKLRQFIEDEKFNGYKHLWEIHEIENNPDNLAQHNLSFRSQVNIKNLVEELIGEYCYQCKIKLKSESGLGKNPVEFKCSPYKEKALFLAKTIKNINFDGDELKKLTSMLRREKTKFCYYIVFIDSSEALEKLKKSVEEIEKFDFQDLFFQLVIINSAQERDLDISSLESQYTITESEYTITEKEVYISYARGGDSGEIVDKLCEFLKIKKIEVIRDSEELKYKNSLKNFMQTLGKGKYVITVISDKYLKSRYCMFELTEFLENGNFQERIVPLIMQDAKIRKPVDIVEYIKFWENELESAEKAMKSVNLSNLSPNIMEDIELYAKITREISNLIGHLRDFLILPIEVHQSSNFEDVVNEINKILSK